MDEWVQWAPGVDLTGKTVRVLTDEERVIAVGQATEAGPVPHRTDELLWGMPMVPDPHAAGLDEAASAKARLALATMAVHAQDCPADHVRGDDHRGHAVAVGFLSTWSLQWLDA